MKFKNTIAVGLLITSSLTLVTTPTLASKPSPARICRLGARNCPSARKYKQRVKVKTRKRKSNPWWVTDFRSSRNKAHGSSRMPGSAK